MRRRNSSRRARSAASERFDWHVPLIGGLLLLLWTTNRRRIKPNFELSGDGSIENMEPSLIGLTEGAIDAGNRVEILQNGAYFDRLLEDIAAARLSIHIESYIWWTGDICERMADALAARAGEVEVRLLLDYSGSSRMDKALMKRMKDAGCQVHQFHPLRVSNIGVMNNRTHRKIAVFDGRVAYVRAGPLPELVSVAQLARLFDVTDRSIRNWLKLGRLPSCARKIPAVDQYIGNA